MKKAKAFTISEEVYVEFQKLAKEKAINMSQFIENVMKAFIKENKEKK